jgi:aspartate/methionine/tyrosine aminotransferase
VGPGLRRDDNGIHAQTTPSIPFPHHRVSDSVAFAREILARTKIGLAPGTAFGPMSEGYMRLCFARDPGFIAAAVERLRPMLD